MQVEFGGKEHEAAIAKILAAAKAAGKIAAIFCESTSFSCIDGQN
jgi:4-hydroxy-2-oxoheptanedioate aldolase